MSSKNWEKFSQHIDNAPELQAKIRATHDVGAFIALAHEQGFPLSAADLKEMAQQAYHNWLSRLEPQSKLFFERLHTEESLNKRHQDCRTPEDVITLAQEYGFALTMSDLKTAAQAAAMETGFSFEKLWFGRLGLLASEPR